MSVRKGQKGLSLIEVTIMLLVLISLTSVPSSWTGSIDVRASPPDQGRPPECANRPGIGVEEDTKMGPPFCVDWGPGELQ